MGRPSRAVAVGLMALVAACGAQNDTSSVTPRHGTFTGATDTGWRVRVEVEARAVTAHLFLPCAAYNSAFIRPDTPVEGQLEEDGSFTLRTERTTEVTTGVERRSVITVSGRFDAPNRVAGEVEASAQPADGCPEIAEGWTAEHAELPTLERLGGKGHIQVLEPAGDHMAAIYQDGENTSGGGVVVLGPDGHALRSASVTDAGFLAYLGAFDASADGTLWWVDVKNLRQLIHRMAPDGSVTTFPIAHARDVGVVGDRVWATVTEEGPDDIRLVEMDTEGRELASLPVGRTVRLITDPAVLWLVPEESGSTVIDPETHQVLARPALHSFDARMRVAGERAWVFSHNGVESFELGDESTEVVDVPSNPMSAAPDDGGVWLAFPYEHALRYVKDGEVRRVVDLPLSPDAIAVSESGDLWIASDGELWRLEVESEDE